MNIREIIDKLKDFEHDARPSHEHEDLAHKIFSKLGKNKDENSVILLTYFLRYGYVPLSENSISEAAKTIGSAPWVGLEGSILEPTIRNFIDEKLIEFSQITELDNSIVLRLSPSPDTGNRDIDVLFAELWKKATEHIKRRKDMMRIVGWAHHTTVREELKEAMKNAPRDATIKLMAYHGRTWLPPTIGVLGFLLDLAYNRNDLRFEILIVDKKAKGKVLEGATQEEHMRASQPGISVLRKMQLPKEILKRFDIRTYGKTDEDSLLRCLIIQTKQKVIKDCYISVWFFGRERGFYGREIWLNGNASLALLCRNYFDSVFKKGWPQVSLGMQFYWIMKNYWFEFMTLGLIPFACAFAVVFGVNIVAILGIAVGSIIAGLTNLRRR